MGIDVMQLAPSGPLVRHSVKTGLVHDDSHHRYVTTTQAPRTKQGLPSL